MAGAKETFEIELNVDHRIFIKSAVDKYGIGSEDKVLRIIMDFVQTNPDLHDSVFTEFRCLRCELRLVSNFVTYFQREEGNFIWLPS